MDSLRLFPALLPSATLVLTVPTPIVKARPMYQVVRTSTHSRVRIRRPSRHFLGCFSTSVSNDRDEVYACRYVVGLGGIKANVDLDPSRGGSRRWNRIRAWAACSLTMPARNVNPLTRWTQHASMLWREGPGIRYTEKESFNWKKKSKRIDTTERERERWGITIQ